MKFFKQEIYHFAHGINDQGDDILYAVGNVIIGFNDSDIVSMRKHNDIYKLKISTLCGTVEHQFLVKDYIGKDFQKECRNVWAHNNEKYIDLAQPMEYVTVLKKESEMDDEMWEHCKKWGRFKEDLI